MMSQRPYRHRRRDIYVISYTGLDIIATKTEISQGTISPDSPTGPDSHTSELPQSCADVGAIDASPEQRTEPHFLRPTTGLETRVVVSP